jgi:hypothetical protein
MFPLEIGQSREILFTLSFGGSPGKPKEAGFSN